MLKLFAVADYTVGRILVELDPERILNIVEQGGLCDLPDILAVLFKDHRTVAVFHLKRQRRVYRENRSVPCIDRESLIVDRLHISREFIYILSKRIIPDPS